MKQKIILAVVVVLALGGGAVWYLQQDAAETAEHQLRRALLDAGIERNVRFRTASFSLLSQSFVLEGVEVSDLGEWKTPITIESVEISDFEKDRDIVTAATVKMRGIRLPLYDEARERYAGVSYGGSGDRMLRTFLSLGYLTLRGDFEASYRLDPAEESLTLATTYKLDGVGGVEWRVVLSRINGRDLVYLIREAKEAAGEESGKAALRALYRRGEDFVRTLETVSLNDLELAVSDDGISERLWELQLRENLIHENRSEAKSMVAEVASTEISRALLDVNFSASDARDYAAKIRDFLLEGGELRFSTDIRRPIRLLQKGGPFGVLPADNIASWDRFLYASYATLEKN